LYRNILLVVILATLSIPIGFTGIDMLENQTRIETEVKNTLANNDVQILFIMDDDYGANYHFIRPILENWGWNVTLAGTSMTIDPCTFQAPNATLDMDLLITDVDSLEPYDAISLMPGNSHEGLLNSQVAHDLIMDANSSGLVIAAWCRAVRVLAASGVIAGVNVTGHADYASEYADAGANYLPGDIPPVIDGNIVTTIRSRFYRQRMCDAIAIALGVYEEDAPELTDVRIDPSVVEPENTSTIIATVADESRIDIVEAIIFTLDPATGEKNSSFAYREIELSYDNVSSYQALMDPFPEGNYSVDIRLVDIWGNSETYIDAVTIVVSSPMQGDSIDAMTLLLIGGIGTIGVVIIVVFALKRK
jgi:protease I